MNPHETTFQILLSTMRQSSLNIVTEMNITSDVLVINQGTDYGHTHLEESSVVCMLSSPELGIGLSRNTALDRAWADICLFADDDIVYEPDVEDIVLTAFASHPESDVIVFNLDTDETARTLKKHTTAKRIFWNSLRYGMPRVAVRLSSIRRSNVHFSLGFGGGALYGSGEDTLFLAECLRAGLKISTYPASLGRISFEGSSWFRGRNERYYHDKGALFAALFPRLWPIFSLRFLVRAWPAKTDHISPWSAFRQLWKGARGWPSADF